MKEKHKSGVKYNRCETTAIEVKALCECGITHERIAKHIGISRMTLRKYYKTELDTALTMKIREVAGSLFKAAQEGDTTAMIFFLKTQGGWSTKIDFNAVDEEAGYDFSKLNDKQLENLVTLMEESKVDDDVEDVT